MLEIHKTGFQIHFRSLASTRISVTSSLSSLTDHRALDFEHLAILSYVMIQHFDIFPSRSSSDHPSIVYPQKAALCAVVARMLLHRLDQSRLEASGLAVECPMTTLYPLLSPFRVGSARLVLVSVRSSLQP